jgi:hypothetical protein
MMLESMVLREVYVVGEYAAVGDKWCWKVLC